MRIVESRLPWSGKRVFAIENLNPYFSSVIGREAAAFLPAQITLFADPEIQPASMERFLQECAEYLNRDLLIRRARAQRLLKTALVGETGLYDFLTGHTHVQPWALYYSKDGGLELPNNDAEIADEGVVPCSTMQNHGVAWSRTDGQTQIWLATARKAGRDWEMDSDIGHESAHAAFAPVPLFVQTPSAPVSLANADGPENLDREHVARLIYLYSELAVCAIRGEARPTDTRLPVADPMELRALLSLSDALLPGAGFDRAVRACSRPHACFDPRETDDIFELAAPVIRVMPKLSCLVNAFTPPTAREFTTLAAVDSEPAVCARP
jgi:hypothetical protein